MLGVIVNTIAFITYVYFGFYTFFLDRKSKINVFFFIVCLIYALWSFSFIIINSPVLSIDERTVWLKIGYTAASLYEPVLIIFALHYAGIYGRIKWKPLFIIGIWIIPLVYLYQNWAHNAIVKDIPLGFWHYSMHIYNNVYNLIAIVIVIIGAVKSKSQRMMLQIKIICSGAIAAIILGLLSDFFLPSKNVITMTPAIVIIWISSTWYALVRHRFLAINQELINMLVLKYIEEVILFLDTNGNIIYANNKFFSVTGLTEENSMTRSIFHFTDNKILRKNIDRLSQTPMNNIMLKVNLTGPGTGTILNVRLQRITDKYGDLLGILFIGKEVRGMERVKEIYGISKREIEIIRQVMSGKTNREIAALLNITERTVKAHLTNIYNKIGIYNKVQLMNAVLEE
jgi:PAS domain S-box-containing protein